MEERVNQNKGITLIALVISIIVILILAGVTIVSLTGNNGILNRTESAKKENEEAKELELIRLAATAARVKGEGTIITENLNNELSTNFNDETIAKESGNNWYYKGYIIDKTGNVKKASKLLPKEYQQVEYIESTGTQWIDLNIKTGENVREFITETEISWKTKQFSRQLTGANNMQWIGVSNGKWDIGSIGSSYDTDVFYKAKNICFINNNGYRGARLYINDALNVEAISSFNSIQNNRQYVFNLGNGATTYKCICKIKYWKLIRDDTIICNLIPCYRKTDNIIGMYNIVNNQFYTNQGTGTFIKGENV